MRKLSLLLLLILSQLHSAEVFKLIKNYEKSIQQVLYEFFQFQGLPLLQNHVKSNEIPQELGIFVSISMPLYQLIPQQQFKQVLIQLKDELVEALFSLEELIYNGVLTKYKAKIGTENIVIISQYGYLVNKHQTFAYLTSFEQPLLNIFNVPDILKLNEIYNEQSNLEKAKEQSIISQEIEQKYQNKINELEAQIQQLKSVIQQFKNQKICNNKRMPLYLNLKISELIRSSQFLTTFSCFLTRHLDLL